MVGLKPWNEAPVGAFGGLFDIVTAEDIRDDGVETVGGKLISNQLGIGVDAVGVGSIEDSCVFVDDATGGRDDISIKSSNLDNGTFGRASLGRQVSGGFCIRNIELK